MPFTLIGKSNFHPYPFNKFLEGHSAFYNHPNYKELTKKELSSSPSDCICLFQSKEPSFPNRLIFKILAALAHSQTILQILAAKLILFPSTRLLLSSLDTKRENILKDDLDNSLWAYKRIPLNLDGKTIDAIIVIKKSSNQKRWVLYSDGQKGSFEGELSKSRELKQILTELDANALLFNLPGVGHSEGYLHRQSSAKTYRLMLTFLENQEFGMGATEIVLFSYSMGAAVKGNALLDHSFKEDIRYVKVLKQGFSTLSKTASLFYSRIPFGLGSLIHLLGFNINSVDSLDESIPTIILQTAKLDEGESYRVLADSSLIIHDKVIPREAAAATFLLDHNKITNKVFFGIKEMHNEKIENTRFLTDEIEKLLRIQNQNHQAV